MSLVILKAAHGIAISFTKSITGYARGGSYLRHDYIIDIGFQESGSSLPQAHGNSLSLLENASGVHSGGGSRIEQKGELSCHAGVDGSLAQPSRTLRNQKVLSHNSVLGQNSSLHTLLGDWMWAVLERT